MYTMGFDIGSASSKIVILKNGEELVTRQVVPLGTGTSGPDKVLSLALAAAGLGLADLAFTVATGYGRNHCAAADKCVSEISCHAKGVYTRVPGVRTIIDIGGQDGKAIFLGPKGRVEQFFMNDKCAAGTGRFLEVMARVLETTVQDLADWDKRAVREAPVSSTCTVFAESEVISLLSNGTSKADIIAGVHHSVAVKAASLAQRGPCLDDVVLSGGVARNAGVVRALSQVIGKKIIVAPDAQTMGAYGAAMYAYDEVRRKGAQLQ